MVRPKKPENERRTAQMIIRLTQGEKAELDAAAQAAGADTSSWARDLLLRAARRQKKKAAQSEDAPAPEDQDGTPE